MRLHGSRHNSGGAWVVGHHDGARERQLWRLRLLLRTLVAVFAVWWMDAGYIWRRCRAGVTRRLLPRKYGAVVECVPGPGSGAAWASSHAVGNRGSVVGDAELTGSLPDSRRFCESAQSGQMLPSLQRRQLRRRRGRCYELHRIRTTSLLYSLWWQEAVSDVTTLAMKMPCVLCNDKLTSKHWDVNPSSIPLFSSKMDLETFWCWTPGYGR